MKKPIIILSVLFLTVRLLAQPLPLGDDFKTYVFGEKVNVRSQPDLEAPVVGKLSAGDPVTILGHTESTTTLNLIAMPWYLVQFQGDQTGYVWGGLLSFGGELNYGNARFVLGVTAVKMKADKPEENITTLELRALQNGSVLDRCAADVPLEGQYGLYAPQLEPGARGLKGYSALLMSTAGYGACGYPWYDWYVLWDGKRLNALPLCLSVSDADVFAHVESYVFPRGANEDEPGHFGKADDVYFKVKHQEKEETSNGWNEKSWTRARRIGRNGRAFVKPKNMEE